MVCAADAEFVAEDGGEVEQGADGRDGEVGVCGPDFGVVRPCRARDCFAIACDVAVGVLCL